MSLYMRSRRAHAYTHALGLRCNGAPRLPWPGLSPSIVEGRWSRSTLCRWARWGVPLSKADDLAFECGVHPCEWWAIWFDLGDPLELGEAWAA